MHFFLNKLTFKIKINKTQNNLYSTFNGQQDHYPNSWIRKKKSRWRNKQVKNKMDDI